jgi:hypothetical protein
MNRALGRRFEWTPGLRIPLLQTTRVWRAVRRVFCLGDGPSAPLEVEWATGALTGGKFGLG